MNYQTMLKEEQARRKLEKLEREGFTSYRAALNERRAKRAYNSDKHRLAISAGRSVGAAGVTICKAAVGLVKWSFEGLQSQEGLYKRRKK